MSYAQGWHSFPPQSMSVSIPFSTESMHVETVGIRVGWGVGISEGPLVGDNDGLIVGDVVGTAVGTAEVHIPR